MTTAIYVPSRIAEGSFDDVPVPGVGDNTLFFRWNNGGESGEWVAAVGRVFDTRNELLGTTPDMPMLGYATDTGEWGIWDGAAWRFAPLELNEVSANPDMGLPPPLVHNDLSGYSREDINRKRLYNIRILGSWLEEEGGIRTTTGEAQWYLNGSWQTVTVGFRFMEDGGLQYQPVGSELWLDSATGNSTAVGLNGVPLVQAWSFVSMGAYPVPLRIQGREITA